MRPIFKHRFILDAAIVVAFLLLAVLPWSFPLEPGMDLSNVLAMPSWKHPLGTDNMGRDLLVRISLALRESVFPLWFAVGAASMVGVLVASFTILFWELRKGRVAVVGLQSIATLLASIPVGIAAFAWSAAYERAGLLPVLMTLAALFCVRCYLQVWDLFRHDRHLGYWDAHHACGGTLWSRIWGYGVKGGWRPYLIDQLGFHLRAALAIEASLSYLGFGVQEPQASFGNILASHFDLYMRGEVHVPLLILLALALASVAPASAARLLSKGYVLRTVLGDADRGLEGVQQANCP